MARVDHLTGVTVCLNYSDYLRVAAQNRRHLDDWLVVTCQKDRATQEVCHQFGLRCLISKEMGEEGECFDSAFAKGPVINEALESLSTNGWVLLLDADVLLPRDFRERLNGLEVFNRCLYGLRGRRQSGTAQEFSAKAAGEPWDSFLDFHPHILGFFQMFRLDQPHNRYPLARSSFEMHDDIAFQHLFKPKLRRRLPLGCLHIGPPMVNWSGRRSVAFSTPDEAAAGSAGDALPLALAQLARPRRRLLWLGYDTTTPFELLHRSFQETLCFDYHGIHATSHYGLVGQDAAERQRLVKERTARFDSIRLCPPLEQAEMVEAIDAFRPDVIFINAELDADQTTDLGRLLKQTGLSEVILSGRYFDLALWKDHAGSIALVFGTPQDRSNDATWWHRIRPADVLAFAERPLETPRPASPERGILTVVHDLEDLTHLLTWLFHGGARMRGNLTVIDASAGLPPLTIAAARMNFSVLQPDPRPGSSKPGVPLSANTLRLLSLSPYQRTVFVPSASELDDDVLRLWDEASNHKFTVLAESRPLTAQKTSAARRKFVRQLAGENELAALANGKVPWSELSRLRSFAHAFDPAFLQEWFLKAKAAERRRSGEAVGVGLIAAWLTRDDSDAPEGNALWFGIASRIPHHQRPAERDVSHLLTTAIPVTDEATIITLVDYASLEWLGETASVWKWQSPREVVVIAFDLPEVVVRAKLGSVAARIVEARFGIPDGDTRNGRARSFDSMLALVLESGVAPELSASAQFIFLAPGSVPVPGASLFTDAEFRTADLALETHSVKTASARPRRPSFCAGGPILVSRAFASALKSTPLAAEPKNLRPNLWKHAEALDWNRVAKPAMTLGWRVIAS